jgi:uncharacterized SAM-binding protein YcdF (DUF218 family)
MSTLKALLMPGSPTLLVLGVVIGALLLLFARTRTLGRRLVIAFAVMYWLFATPVSADALAGIVAGGLRPATRQSAKGIQAIVVLDGGTSWYRVGDRSLDVPLDTTALRGLEAARVYALLSDPLVIVTGGTVGPARAGRPEGGALVETLVRAGVPRDRVLLDTTSANTRAHAVNVSAILRARGISRFVLVTSATHLRRAMLAFRNVGLQPVPSAAPLRSADDARTGLSRWMPDRNSLWISEQAVYDAVGLAYYWIRGWV